MVKLREEVDAFKNELKNLNYYKKKIKEINEKIEVLEYEMEGVKGVDYSKQHGSPNEAVIEIKKIAMSDEMEFLLNDRQMWLKKIDYIVRVLNKMERTDRDIVERIYVSGERYNDLCSELGIKHTSSLYNAVDNAIGCALKKARV